MTPAVKHDLIDITCSVISYMLSADLFQPAWVLSENLHGIASDAEMMERMKDTKEDVRRTLEVHSLSFEDAPRIPDRLQSEEERLLWLSSQSVSNLFQYGAFEMGYVYLMDFAAVWIPVYTLVAAQLKSLANLDDLSEWCMMHMLLAADVCQKQTFEIGGMKITVETAGQ